MNLWDILFGVEKFKQPIEKAILPAIFSYKDRNAQQLVFAVKRGSAEAGRIIAGYMRPYIPRGAIVVPIPSSRKRGYNHCVLIARHFEMATILYRKEKTEQKKLNRKSRFENTKGSLYAIVPEELKNRTFCIIDDVMTTGATLKEAERTLREAGVQKVIVLVFAH